MRRLLLCTYIAIVRLAGSAAAATIPSGMELNVRLTTEASSGQKPGTRVEAVVVVPVFVDGVPVLDSGTKLTGSTADSKTFKAASGVDAEEPATVRLQFTGIQNVGGKSIPISCVVAGVENARESVDATGLITGIQASETFGAQMDRGINKLQERYGQFAGILSQLKGSIVKEVDPSIDFRPGVDLTLKLTRSLDWNAPVVHSNVGSVNPAADLAVMANSQPLRTTALKPPEPSDMTNLMFIGTLEQLQTAFQSAGWFPAAALSESSKMETARAIIENRGYNEAPMSILTLDGRPPDLALQKQNDTFSMRHHIRIWQRPQQFDGKPVWVAAATHDISITFSAAAKSFTHGIDPSIDKERSKVVNDMLFTGKVRGVALVDRTNLPPDPSNATGDKLLTDGKIAVVEF